MWNITYFSSRIKQVWKVLKEELIKQDNTLLAWTPVVLSCGIILYFSMKKEPGIFLLGTLTLAGIALSFTSVLSKRRAVLYAPIVIMVLGFLNTYWRTVTLYPNKAIIKHKTHVKDVIGILQEIDYKPGYVQILFCDVKIKAFDGICVRLAVRTSIDPEVRIGDVVKFSAVLTPPSIAVDGGYDFARVAYFRGISAVGYSTSEIEFQERKGRIEFIHWVERIRHRVYKILAMSLDRDSTEVMSALLIGKRLGIRREIQESIRNLGLAHLFAISGLHLSFVAGMLFWFSRSILSCFEAIALAYNTKKMCSVIAIIGSFFYLLLSGSSISAFRAFVMVALSFLGVVIDRQHNSLGSLSTAAIIILISRPEALLSPSFQMSFAAVVALISTCSFAITPTAVNSITRYLVLTFISSIVASLATAPYSIYHFHSFSIAGVIANVVAIPVTTFIIIPLGMLYLFGYFLLGKDVGIAYVLKFVIGSVLRVAEYAAQIRVVPTFFSMHVGSLLSITLGLLVLCLCRGSLRIIGGIFFVGFGVFSPLFYKPPDILCDSKAVAVMERDGKLYFAVRTASIRGFTYALWAKNNGQERIRDEKYKGELEERLVCEEDGCTYDGRVIISDDVEFILRHCNDDIAVLISIKSDYRVQCNNSATIGLSDIKRKGVHRIWLKKHDVKIKNAVTSRMWHIAFAHGTEE